MVFNKNEFGELVKAYRKQRGWTQEELAERWGHSREYVTSIETGRRRLDSTAQVVRLADILDIPQAKLETIGRGIPQRQSKSLSPAESDNALLQMLLSPGKDMVRLSWLVWYADAAPHMEENLRALVLNLDQALTAYNGEFRKPAQQLLAYAHQMIGKIAFDRLDYAAAGGHFSEMIDLGHELNDADIITTGMVHQGDVLRKRGRYDAGIRCFEAASPYAEVATLGVQGRRLMIMGRAYAAQGNEEQFLHTANRSLEIAEGVKDTLDNLANQFSLVDALQEKAQGFTTLWKPGEALEIYKQTDQLRSFRHLRDRGSYAIVKAQAYSYAGDLDKGLEYAVRGLGLAAQYQSKRHVARLEIMYNRLRVTPIGKNKRLDTLRDALLEAQRKQAGW
jgi:transcriptional regulator with XRE-family HTH domain